LKDTLALEGSRTMKKCRSTFSLLLLMTAAPLYANPTGIVSTVVVVGPYGNQAGTFIFQLANQPTTGCSNNGNFEVSPTTVADAESRRNIFATLLSAKLPGTPVAVVYDTGAFATQ
jgi:hypothetical protein